MPSTFTLSSEAQASMSEILRLVSDPARKYTSAAIQAAISFSHGSNCWCNVFSRITFLSSVAAAPQSQLLDYGNDIYVSEIVSVHEALKRVGGIASGIWRCGSHDIRIVRENFTDQVNLIRSRGYISTRHRYIHSDWPADYYEAHAMDPTVPPESRYLSSAITIYPSMEDLICDKFQADLREQIGWRGVIQMFLPNYAAKIIEVRLEARRIAVRTEKGLTPIDELSYRIVARRKGDVHEQELPASDKETAVTFNFQPDSMDVCLVKKQDSSLIDFFEAGEFSRSNEES